MAQYFSPETWKDLVYVIAVEDNVEYDFDGADSKPNVDNHQRFRYLKKQKSTLIVGSGIPEGTLGISFDNNELSNAYYFNIDNGGFYYPTWENNTVSKWVNIQAGLNLNIPELNLNSGTTSAKTFFEKIDNVIKFQDSDGTLANLTVKSISFNKGTSHNGVQVHTNYNEIMVNSDVLEESENNSGKFSIKNYDVFENGVNKSMTYIPESTAWSFGKNRVAVGGLTIQEDIGDENENPDIPAPDYYADVIVNTQSVFDAIFGQDIGESIGTESRVVCIKPTTPYLLKNDLTIGLDYFTVFDTGEATVVLNDDYKIKFVGSYFDIKLNITVSDYDTVTITNLIDITEASNSKFDIRVFNMKCNTLVLADSSNSIGNHIKITNADLNNEINDVFINVDNTFINGFVNKGDVKTFDNCNKLVLNGNFGSSPELGFGDYDS